MFEVLLVEETVVTLDELHVKVVDLVFEDGDSLVLDELVLLNVLICSADRRDNLGLTHSLTHALTRGSIIKPTSR